MEMSDLALELAKKLAKEEKIKITINTDF